MTNPRAHAQESKIATPHRIRAKLKRFFGPWGMFVRGFIKHPVMVGSIVPSSPTLIRHMLRPVDWKTTKLFVEYGPGVGTFCRPIRSDGRRVGQECVSTGRFGWSPGP